MYACMQCNEYIKNQESLANRSDTSASHISAKKFYFNYTDDIINGPQADDIDLIVNCAKISARIFAIFHSISIINK